MSENYTRKQIKCVDASPIIMGGAVLALTLGAALLQSLSRSAKNAYRSVNTGPSIKPLNIKSKISLSEKEPLFAANQLSLSPAERIKISTLIALKNSGCVVEKSDFLKQKMDALQAANIEADARRAQNSLYKELEKNQDMLFMKGLTIACERAAVKTGFNSIETRKTPDGKAVRIIASDANGRTLVTEVIEQNDKNKQIVSELIGVCDGSCKHIMNFFDKSLQEQGVRSLPPERKFTGGVCATNAAIEFLSRTVNQCQNTNTGVVKKDKIFRRVQSLNQNKIIRTKY